MPFRPRLPLIIQPYRGYANRSKVFLQGRVLSDKGLSRQLGQSRFRNFLDSFRRFESDEAKGVAVVVRLGHNLFNTTTDREGYFRIDARWELPGDCKEGGWYEGEVVLPAHDGVSAKVAVCFPAPDARLGILSDIDDTVLQTHVNSPFKWNMLYATLFKNAHERQPMEGMPELLRRLATGSAESPDRPVFYVSDSPWNIYDLLVDFMKIRQLPRGPILLRDYGRQIFTDRGKFAGHKLRVISHIMDMYPELSWIMLGDTASKDADYYLRFARKYSGRVAAIYIRHTRANRNARRVAKLLQEQTEVEAVLVHSSSEIVAHATLKGYLI